MTEGFATGYQPAPGSHAEVMVVWLKLQGCELSSGDLAAAAGIEVKQVFSIMSVPLKHGLVKRVRVSQCQSNWQYLGGLTAQAVRHGSVPRPGDQAMAEPTAVAQELDFEAPPIRRTVAAVDATQPAWRSTVRPACSVFDLDRHAHDCQA